MKLSIIIPTHERNEVFYTSLDFAYKAINKIDGEIIVVNDSKTNIVELDPNYQDKVQLFQNPKKGVASARNLGAEKAKGDLFLFLDDDVNIKQENLAYAFTFFNKHKEATCLNLSWEYPQSLKQKVIREQFGRFLIKAGYTNMKNLSGNPSYWQDNKCFEVDLFASYCLFMPREIFESLNGYREEVPFGYEDYDFAHRAKLNGVTTYLDSKHIVYHNEFDRINLQNWLNRRRVEGYGRKLGPQVAGHQQESVMTFHPLKKKIFGIGIYLKPLLLSIVKFIPNLKVFDTVYNFVIKFLLGISFYEGYAQAQSLNR